jgi:hypothetical protein
MRHARRWMFTIAAVVIAVAALAVSRLGLFGPSSEECKPVQELLDYNRAQGEHIAAKTGDAQGIPTAAEETAYQAWADGMAERAQKVTSPDLARTATTVATLANDFVGQLSALRAQADSRAPGAPAPPAAFEMAALNARISDNLAQLSKACS